MSRAKGVAFIVAAQVLAASTPTMAAKALQGFTPLALVFWTSVLGGLILLPAVVSQWASYRARWPLLAAAGVLGYGACVVASTTGVRLSGPMTTSLLSGLQPVALLLLSTAWLKEPLDGRKIAAVLLGLAGAAVLLNSSFSARIFEGRSLGVLLLVAAALLAAVRSLLAKKALAAVSPLGFAGITTILAIAPIAAAAGPQINVSGLLAHKGAWAAMAGLAVVGTVGCRFLGCKALVHMPASETAPYFFLQPLAGALMGAAWESRWLSEHELAGGLLILAGAGLALGRALPRTNA
jgi:drug/metabolite transporter (DMT)-like permease